MSHNPADYPELESACCSFAMEVDSCLPIAREGFYDVPWVTRKFVLPQERGDGRRTCSRSTSVHVLGFVTGCVNLPRFEAFLEGEGDRSTEPGRIYTKLLVSEVLQKLRPNFPLLATYVG